MSEERDDRASAGTLIMPEPMPHVVPILADSSRFKVLICGRRFAKTFAMREAAILGHGPTRALRGALSGGNVLWLLPTNKMARETWDFFESSLRDVWKRKNATERFIDFPTKGRLSVKSADEPESLRGPGYDGVVFDELKDHKLKTWKEVVRPMLADKRGWLFAGGSAGAPKMANLAYYLFNRAKNRPGWRCWQRPSSDNPLMTPAEVADMRSEMTPAEQAREIDAQFESASGNKFRREWFQLAKADGDGWVVAGKKVHRSDLRIFMTCDLAATVKTSSDDSALAVWGQAGDDLVLLEMAHGQFEAAMLLEELHRLNAKWKPGGIYLESGPYNNLASAVLKVREELPIREVQPETDKVARARTAILMAEQKHVWLAEGKWLEDFLIEVGDWTGDPTEPDDQVDVLSYAARVALVRRPLKPRARDRDEEEDHRPWLIGRGDGEEPQIGR